MEEHVKIYLSINVKTKKILLCRTEYHIHNSKTFAELVDYVMKWDKTIYKLYASTGMKIKKLVY